MKINENYNCLKEDYLFKEIAEKTALYKKENPGCEIIRLGIGDVTLPLAKTVVKAMRAASAEMGDKATFRGYGEYQGYEFLRRAICLYYQRRNVIISDDEVFVSDGAKSDLGNILDIFSADNSVLIPNPVYPVYVDTNIMAGRKITYIDGTEDNGFLPLPDYRVAADIIYLCSPNNPTGAVYNKNQLKEWVNYALNKNAVILFDAAYEAFISDADIPKSIYEIEGAEKCAVEFCSLSKTAGFTGTRCGYTIVPKSLIFEGANLNKLWLRRQSTKFNGVSYVIQRAAEAVFSLNGLNETSENISYYRDNAKIIAQALQDLGIWFTGGINSPYIWLKCPCGCSSWDFFDLLLSNAGIVGTPGAGFGSNGEGYFRLTAFNDRASTEKAVCKIKEFVRNLNIKNSIFRYRYKI